MWSCFLAPTMNRAAVFSTDKHRLQPVELIVWNSGKQTVTVDKYEDDETTAVFLRSVDRAWTQLFIRHNCRKHQLANWLTWGPNKSLESSTTLRSRTVDDVQRMSCGPCWASAVTNVSHTTWSLSSLDSTSGGWMPSIVRCPPCSLLNILSNASILLSSGHTVAHKWQPSSKRTDNTTSQQHQNNMTTTHQQHNSFKPSDVQ